MQIRKRGDEIKKNISSETTEPISTKLCWNDPWAIPFQNCVRQCRPVSKMAAMTKNRNFFTWPKVSILSQKVPKFELYEHNDELFNIYYRIFYELWTFTYFDRLCKLEKRGDEIKENLLWNYWANLNQTLLKWSLGGPLSKLCPSAPSCI
jgi:hypothetical protein